MEETREIDKILQDIENGLADETLPRLTEDDVALDMDEIVVEDDEFVNMDQSDDNKGEGDVSWMDDKQWEMRVEADDGRHRADIPIFTKSHVTKCDINKTHSVWPSCF